MHSGSLESHPPYRARHPLSISWSHDTVESVQLDGMSAIPRIARVPLTSKQPEACPHCGGRNLTRRGTRRKKLEIVQLWRCSACKRTFTPGPAALHNKTYPLRVILSAIIDYDLGYKL